MAARPIWSGFLKLSLISVPVKAYTATDSSEEVRYRAGRYPPNFFLRNRGRPFVPRTAYQPNMTTKAAICNTL
jgi:hypothetical protein